jgi:ADP-heptose:LPS heptosyltransferase
MNQPPRRLLLIHKRAPGDTVVLTGLVRDIALAHPGKFEIAVDTNAMALWNHNPYIAPLEELKSRGKVEHIKVTYGKGLRDQNHETVHFLSYFHRDFEVQTRVRVPVMLPYPDLHLSAEEKASPIVEGRYWVFLSGGKSDFTAKVWGAAAWKETVRQLGALGIPTVQIGGTDKGHWHPEIPGALNLVGRTSHRDWLRLIYHADGVICGVTGAMHIAAALQRPCVVLAGGREAWWWEAYVRENRGLGGQETAQKLAVPHRFLHTIGLLDCCRAHGCWKNKVLPLKNDPSVCKYPIVTPGQAVPKCLQMITPEHVIEAVMSYYEDKTLPPIKSLDLVHRFSAPECTVSQIPVLAQTARFERQEPGTPVTAPPSAVVDNDIYANPVIGGKYTVFVLFYGPSEYHALHMRCLNAIISTCPPRRIELRVGSNMLCEETAAVINRLVDHGVVKKHYQRTENVYKYPLMREMFYDPELPIETNYLLWFDDDSIADRNQQWLTHLTQTIIANPTAALFGSDMHIRLSPSQQAYYKSRPWYKGKPFRLKNQQPAPNGENTVFVAGGFFALKTEAMRAADVPDATLTHNGGDYTIGEQLYQAGYGVVGWNRQKQFIHTSSVKRRGEAQPHFGTEDWKRVFRVAT